MRVKGAGFGVSGDGFRVEGTWYKGVGIRVKNLGFRVQGIWHGVPGGSNRRALALAASVSSLIL